VDWIIIVREESSVLILIVSPVLPFHGFAYHTSWSVMARKAADFSTNQTSIGKTTAGAAIIAAIVAAIVAVNVAIAAVNVAIAAVNVAIVAVNVAIVAVNVAVIDADVACALVIVLLLPK